MSIMGKRNSLPIFDFRLSPFFSAFRFPLSDLYLGMKKLLVANRGEIALRVMRSAKEMGISTVAVYSEADRHAPFVRFADEAVCIGPAPSKESYLVFDKIIQVCKDLKVDAVHPGYGFLSENGDFCRALEKAGVTFVGP